MYIVPAIADFKALFTRDFPFQPTVTAGSPAVPANPLAMPPTPYIPAVPAVVADPSNYVQDSDISRALADVALQINSDLCPTQDFYTSAYLWLTAHMLIMNLRASAQGLGSSFSFLLGSSNVGSVGQSQAIPARILENPEWAWLCATSYGARYIMMVLPNLAGAFGTVSGWTTP